MTDPHSTVRVFWDDMAIKHGANDTATAPDSHYRSLEIKRIIPHLTEGADVLDVGCGNGYGTLKFSDAVPKSRFLGVDYSEPMIKEAMALAKTQRKTRHVSYMVADVLELDRLRSKFDIIVSERCLINLASWEDQKKALLQIKYALNPGGKVILVENTQEGLANLNRLRAQFNLAPIQTRWHNQYLPQRELTDFLKMHFKVLNVENIGNLYYIMSRVLYAKMAHMDGVEPQYGHVINALAAQMPSLPGYHYSPNFMFVLRGL